ncbi:MAG: universal stress protein [Cyanobacteria bacterium P01_H01_bin.15]
MSILIALNLHSQEQGIVKKACQLAKAFSMKIWLLHVAQPEPEFVGYGTGPQSVRDSVAKRFHEEHLALQALASEIRSDGFDCSALLIQGETVPSILKEAEKLSVEMIIVGSHHKGIVQKLIFGHTFDGILQRASIPVLVVPIS